MSKKEKREEQIERISTYEKKLDEVQEALRELERALERWADNQQHIRELDRYYQSELWKKDFRDDEAGKLPEDLKRGVLSEDGIWNVLEKNAELSALIRSGEE